MKQQVKHSVSVVMVSAVLALWHVPAALAAGVVGNGNPASCTEAALRAAIVAGGDVTFNCGSAPTTITFADTIEVRNTVSIDGGGLITFNGNGKRLFFHRSYATTASALSLKNLTITAGRAVGANSDANGGAIRSVNNSIDGKSYPQTLTLENVMFRDNDATLTDFSGNGAKAYDFGGGAVFSQGGAVIVKNSTFRDNDANNGAGGAIHLLQSSISIENSVFANNTALGKTAADSLGGAMYVDGLSVVDANARLTITGSTFDGNRAYNSGGAIHFNAYNNTNSFSIDQSAFTNNAVVAGQRAQGGAIGGGGTGGSPRITITRSLFAGNSAKKSGTPADGSGGALAFPQPTTLRIENSTFNGNRAEGSSYNANGGALYVVNNSTPFALVNNTFASNFAGWVGGAISNSQINRQPGGSVVNTIFANNTAGNGPNDWNIQQQCSSELTDGGGNLQFPGRLTGSNFFNDVTCFQNKSAPNQTGLPDFRDPKLAPLADNGGPTKTMAIAAGSPALDGGKAGACPATDQRGTTRPQGAACDIGAFELVQKLEASPALVERAAPQFTLTVRGTGFTTASKILIDGVEQTTVFVNATTLTTQISGAGLAVGTHEITVSGSTLGTAQIRVVERLQAVHVPLVVK